MTILTIKIVDDPYVRVECSPKPPSRTIDCAKSIKAITDAHQFPFTLDDILGLMTPYSSLVVVEEADWPSITKDEVHSISVGIRPPIPISDGVIEFMDTEPFRINQYIKTDTETECEFISFLKNNDVGFTDTYDDYGESVVAACVLVGSPSDTMLTLRGSKNLSRWERRSENAILELLPEEIAKLIVRLNIPLPNTLAW